MGTLQKIRFGWVASPPGIMKWQLKIFGIEGSILGEQMLLSFFREKISSEELSVGVVIERILKCM